MPALEWFEEISEMQKRVRDLAAQIEAATSAAGPHGQSMGSTGGGGRHDPLAGVDRLIDADVRHELRLARAALSCRIACALWVLYGISGRGGLAKARSSAEADILLCHYLQGMSWAEIASQIVRPDTEYPRQWCRAKAVSACRYIDRVGMGTLADS